MIDVDLGGGTYVVAVSGGVDSMVLLHVLAQKIQKSDESIKLIVAHFDHGIRPDSDQDRVLVERLAKHYRLPFVYERGRLGADASEAAARKARYDFLHKLRLSSGSKAVITAHHQDDLIETAMVNAVRGTKSRGLHSLKSTDIVKRPLLNVTKKQLRKYAKLQGLLWREDSTNANLSILRNYIRSKVEADIGRTRRTQLLRKINRAAEINREIDFIIANYLHVQPTRTMLNRQSFIELPYAVAREILAVWLRSRASDIELTRRTLDRLTVAAKVGKNGSKVDVMNGYHFELTTDHVVLRSEN